MMARRSSKRSRNSNADAAGVAFFVAVGAFGTDAGRTVLFLIVGFAVFVAFVWVVYRMSRAAGRRAHGHEGTVTIETLRTMSPDQFEEVTAQMLRNVGFQHVRVDGGAGDLGADVTAVSPSGMRTVVQCKRYSETNRVTSSEMQLFVGMAYMEHKADLAMYVTTGTFTRPAEELGRRHRIVLVDAQGIVDGVKDELEEAGML